MRRPLPDNGSMKRWFCGVENGRIRIETSQDVEPIIELNKKLANESKGYSKSRELRHIAQIPFNVLHMWSQVDGVNLFALHRREKLAYLRRKLNDPDWRFLRTSGGGM